MPSRKRGMSNLGRLSKSATRARRLRATETPEARAKRLERDRNRIRKVRASETPEEREMRLLVCRIRRANVYKRQKEALKRAVKSEEEVSATKKPSAKPSKPQRGKVGRRGPKSASTATEKAKKEQGHRSKGSLRIKLFKRQEEK